MRRWAKQRPRPRPAACPTMSSRVKEWWARRKGVFAHPMAQFFLSEPVFKGRMADRPPRARSTEFQAGRTRMKRKLITGLALAVMLGTGQAGAQELTGTLKNIK